MFRVSTKPRPNWQAKAKEFGFGFHTMYGEPYWDESAYYQFTLEQIERDLEEPSEEIHQMCLEVVAKVVRDESLMRRFQIPENMWDFVANSWREQEPSLYSRLDLAYSGNGPAKLLENNADTPTSLFETGFWQWLWLEDKVDRGDIPRQADQFNLLQDRLIQRFHQIAQKNPHKVLHFSCCMDTEEDRGTVQYMQDCAAEAGIETKFVFIEDIGLSSDQQFTDLDDQAIDWMFKLYPWEFMFREEFAQHLAHAKGYTDKLSWLEPAWKSLISNKAILPLLWQMFPNHPNLLASYFSDDKAAQSLQSYVKKPIFAREGANISMYKNDQPIAESDGPYGDEGFIIQDLCLLPKFENNHTLIGSWLINDKAAGISIREDSGLITQDLSRYLPHIIL